MCSGAPAESATIRKPVCRPRSAARPACQKPLRANQSILSGSPCFANANRPASSGRSSRRTYRPVKAARAGWPVAPRSRTAVAWARSSSSASPPAPPGSRSSSAAKASAASAARRTAARCAISDASRSSSAGDEVGPGSRLVHPSGVRPGWAASHAATCSRTCSAGSIRADGNDSPPKKEARGRRRQNARSASLSYTRGSSVGITGSRNMV
mmetsp:Transcript_16809/g.53860  ORF Transcript_16809/g.53860 Transcript_16809/m.53860 type:complete len:211 (+) Transcript_16809:912-1544(+)